MMYLDLFSKDYIERSYTTGIIIPRDLNYIKKIYNFNIEQISSYYESRNFAVKNTNLLSRMIEHVAPHIGYDVFRYLDYVEDKLKYLGKHFRLTSDIEKGIVHFNEFFGNSEEIIFSLDDYSNPQQISKNWKKEKCIFLIKCTKDDTRLLLPLGRDDGSRGGLNSIGINLPVLAIKYREFLKEQMLSEVKLGKNHFVIKYVLNNTVDDMVDFMLLNRVMNRFYGIENTVPKYKHMFKLFDPSTQLDRYVDDTLNVITEKKIDFLNIMFNVHLVTKINMAELMILPDMAGTRQSRWALFLSRLDYMIFLYDVSKDKTRSKIFINDWKRLVKRFENDFNIDGMFSFEIEHDLKEKMYKIKNM